MIVVADTSPLNYLILINQAHVLPVLYHRVAAPPAVVAELRHLGSPESVQRWATTPPTWLEVVAPSTLGLRLSLGAGESEAIALAMELTADLLLIDERKATIAASQLGLPSIGTLGVLELAARRQLLDLSESIAALEQTTFRSPKTLIDELLRRDALRRSR